MPVRSCHFAGHSGTELRLGQYQWIWRLGAGTKTDQDTIFSHCCLVFWYAGTPNPVQEWPRDKMQIKQSDGIGWLRRFNDHVATKGLENEVKLGGNRICESKSWNHIVQTCFKKKISKSIPWMTFYSSTISLLSSSGCPEFCLYLRLILWPLIQINRDSIIT